MHKYKLLRAASAVALIAAMSTAAVSQSGGGSSGGGSSGGGSAPTQGQQTQGQQRMPDASPGSSGEREQGTRPMERSQDKAAPKSQVQGERDTPRASDRAQDKASPKSRVQGQGETPKASDRAQEKASPKSSVGERRGDDDGRRSAGDRDKDGKDHQRQSRERDSDRGDKQRSDDRGKDRSKGMTDRGQKDGDRTRQGEADRDSRGAGERVQLSQQQRTQVQDRLRQSGRSNRITNVNFDIRVGASVPRSVTLVALPPDIVQIVPEYRGYQYVYAGESILIVDPNDYTVIAVLGSGSQTARRSGGRLTVSSDDRVFIRSHVDLAPAIRLGIGGISIGMSLPTDVELRPLPETVWQRVPDLRDHRYFVYENEIVIVEPQSREVVLVLED